MKPSNLLAFDEALNRLLNAAHPTDRTESIPLLDADGRILAADLHAPINVPGFDNSAMDGYALHIAQFDTHPTRFPVSQRIAAGETGQPLPVGEAARIFTGAPVPHGCNAVVPQEDVQVEADGSITLTASLRPGQHIRRVGEDIGMGSVVLPAGRRLSPQDIALAASIGHATLDCRPRLRVALLCTGDELARPGEPLPPGGIYNSNAYSIALLARRLGCEVEDMGRVADTREATVAALREAARQHDVVITCGGVSVGEEDHVKAAVSELGQLDLWRIAMKPGKPLAFGKVLEADFIGLPGNPVSAFLTFCLLARPFLLRRQGAAVTEPTRITVPAGFERARADSRREFLRARLTVDVAGMLTAVPHVSQGSAVMSGLCWADGLVDVGVGETIQLGQPVQYLLLDSLIN